MTASTASPRPAAISEMKAPKDWPAKTTRRNVSAASASAAPLAGSVSVIRGRLRRKVSQPAARKTPMYSGVGASEHSFRSERPWLQITAPWACWPPSRLAASCAGTSVVCAAAVPSDRGAATATAAVKRSMRGRRSNIVSCPIAGDRTKDRLREDSAIVTFILAALVKQRRAGDESTRYFEKSIGDAGISGVLFASGPMKSEPIRVAPIVARGRRALQVTGCFADGGTYSWPDPQNCVSRVYRRLHPDGRSLFLLLLRFLCGRSDRCRPQPPLVRSCAATKTLRSATMATMVGLAM